MRSRGSVSLIGFALKTSWCLFKHWWRLDWFDWACCLSCCVLVFFFLFLFVMSGRGRRDLASVHWHVDPRWISGRKAPTFRCFLRDLFTGFRGRFFNPPSSLLAGHGLILIWPFSRPWRVKPSWFSNVLRCKLNIFSHFFCLFPFYFISGLIYRYWCAGPTRTNRQKRISCKYNTFP